MDFKKDSDNLLFENNTPKYWSNIEKFGVITIQTSDDKKTESYPWNYFSKKDEIKKNNKN